MESSGTGVQPSIVDVKVAVEALFTEAFPDAVVSIVTGVLHTCEGPKNLTQVANKPGPWTITGKLNGGPPQGEVTLSLRVTVMAGTPTGKAVVETISNYKDSRSTIKDRWRLKPDARKAGKTHQLYARLNAGLTLTVDEM